MEHRWGLRREVEQAVHLWAPGGIAASGQLRNISISGALVRSSLPVALFGRIRFRVATPGGPGKGKWLAEAQVVRLERNGFAVEWCEFAPLLARALIRNARAHALAQRALTPTAQAEVPQSALPR
jgi:hypothetical protein